MSKSDTLSAREAHCKAQAKHYLEETQKILRDLKAERLRAGRSQRPEASILDQVRTILHGK